MFEGGDKGEGATSPAYEKLPPDGDGISGETGSPVRHDFPEMWLWLTDTVG